MEAMVKPQRSVHAAYQPVEDEAVIINLNTGVYYSLNDTGARFWELLDGQRTITECAEVIAAEYNEAAATIEADLLELAGELQDEGLIVI